MTQHPLLPETWRIEAIAFDFDGTLARPVLDFALMGQRVGQVLQRHMGTLPPRNSLPVMEWIDHSRALLHATAPHHASTMHAEAHATLRAIEVEAASRTHLFPFTRPLLRQLARRGIHTAIITRNCPEAVRAVFPDVDDHCPCLLTRDDVPAVKPDPDHLLRALHTLGTRPHHALMVGDHPMDVITGQRAGTRTAGVASGEASEAALHTAGADIVAADCQHLMDLLSALR